MELNGFWRAMRRNFRARLRWKGRRRKRCGDAWSPSARATDRRAGGACTAGTRRGAGLGARGAMARAGNGVAYLAFDDRGQAAQWLAATNDRAWSRVIAKAPPEDALELDLWPSPGPDLDLMRRLKATFDPHALLNNGRLYGRI